MFKAVVMLWLVLVSGAMAEYHVIDLFGPNASFVIQPDGYAVLTIGGGVTPPTPDVWPDDADFYPSTVIWCEFNTSTNVQPDISAVGTNVLVVTGATWQQATNSQVSAHYVLDGINDELTAQQGEAATTFAWMGKTGGVWRAYTVTNGVKFVNNVAQTFAGNWYSTNGGELTWGSTNGGGFLACSIDTPVAGTSAWTSDNRADYMYRGWYDHGFPRYMMDTNDVLAYRPTSLWSNAVAIYTFEDPTFTPSPGKAQDWRGSNHGTHEYMAAATVNGTNGVPVFNGTSSYITVAANSAFDATSTLTVAAWVNVSNSANRAWVSRWEANQTDRQFLLAARDSPDAGIAAEASLTITEDDGTELAAFSTTWNVSTYAGQWTHVCGVADGSNLLIYINGVRDGAAQAYDGTIETSGTAFNIGRLRAGQWFAWGSIDEVYYSHSALSSNQVYQLYLDTKDMFP
jgi:hypothetical protein